MGFFDTVKQKAGVLAGDAGRAGKVTAAQTRLVVLQNDVRRAERDLGHAAFALMDRGELAHPDLADVLARLRAALAEVGEKEAEIAKLRGPQPPAAETPPDEAPAPVAVVVEATVEAPTTKPGTEEAPAEKAAEEAPAVNEELAGAKAVGEKPAAAKKPGAAKKPRPERRRPGRSPPPRSLPLLASRPRRNPPPRSRRPRGSPPTTPEHDRLPSM